MTVTLCHVIPVYTNSLLATLNARKMIRSAGEHTQSIGDNFSLSLREFPKTGTSAVASRVNDSSNLSALKLIDSVLQPTNISRKVNTTKEFQTDSTMDSDMMPSSASL
jgi:hypothetical protein